MPSEKKDKKLEELKALDDQILELKLKRVKLLREIKGKKQGGK
jgi:hypothetical protein